MGVKLAPELLKKTPVEIVQKDFEFDGDDLAAGETIATIVSLVVTPGGGMTASSPVISGTRVQVELAGGVADTRYVVTLVVTTTAGQKLQGDGEIEVRL